MKFLCFDIESCDGGRNGSLCSFGYCLADEKFNIVEQDDIIVNPKKAFNKRLFGSVIKLAYTEDVFRSAPRFPQVYGKIKSLFSSDVIVIGFSILNDVNYLADSIRTYSLDPIYYEFYDVQLMYSIFKKQARNFGLNAAASEFDIDYLEHRSVDDAVATLKVLKGILDSSGKTFSDFVKAYGIVNGSISQYGVKNCFTDMMYSEIDYSNVKIKKRLLNEFLLIQSHNKKTGLIFSHKVVCFDENLELDDISLTRNRIAKLYELGGRYSSGIESSNIFVYNGTQTSRYQYALNSVNLGHKLRFLTLNSFLEMLGEIPNICFDDYAILNASNKRRRLNRERSAQKNRIAQKHAYNFSKPHSPNKRS